MICRRSWTFAFVAAATALQVETVRPQAPDVPAVDRGSTAGLLNSYCVTCHNAKLKTAGLAIDTLDLGNVARDAPLWEKVATKLRTHEMPPPGRPRPNLAGYASATTAIEAALDAAAAAHPQPGRVPVHRLNRAEYTNAIRDLLDVRIDDPALLIPDEPDQHGFDNIASLLSISTARLERYLSAARKVSRLAIGDPTVTPAVE